eukprot:12298730-Alexandrium_andersonii.AAC.1
MSASLVGSEMCIRDRALAAAVGTLAADSEFATSAGASGWALRATSSETYSWGPPAGETDDAEE